MSARNEWREGCVTIDITGTVLLFFIYAAYGGSGVHKGE